MLAHNDAHPLLTAAAFTATTRPLVTQGVLHAHKGKFSGVLNGIDPHCWDPESDIQLAEHYSSGGTC